MFLMEKSRINDIGMWAVLPIYSIV